MDEEKRIETNRTYHDEIVVRTNGNTILWRNGIYEKKGILMDSELIIDIYERGTKEKESKMQKMKITIWILGATVVAMVDILLFSLI